MPKRKKSLKQSPKSKPENKIRIDVKTWSASIPRPKNKVLNISLNGLPQETIIYLAIMGAVSILKNKANPFSVWEEITKGNVTGKKPKHVSQVIQSISKITGKSISECQELWKKLDKNTKRQIKNDPVVRKNMLNCLQAFVDLDRLFEKHLS